MLVLTRRPEQRIVIGDDIVLTVLEVRGDQVRLGIHAPRHVAVHREEVLLTLAQANAAAAAAPVSLPARPTPPLPTRSA